MSAAIAGQNGGEQLRTMKWLKIVLIPLAVIAFVIGVVFKLFGWMPLGIAPSAYMSFANTLFLVIIVILLLRLVRQSEVI